jgi:hypothetical protein
MSIAMAYLNKLAINTTSGGVAGFQMEKRMSLVAIQAQPNTTRVHTLQSG